MTVHHAVLLIFTGGTISMAREAATGAYAPLDFDRLQHFLPELSEFPFRIDSIHFDPMVDSSDISPDDWKRLATAISDHYDDYDGFVVLHGTDTMAYSASALSFMLKNLTKPVIFTGSQLPVGVLRSDAKENLLTAIEMAAARRDDGHAMVPEVCIFFEDTLFRGNRTTKMNAEHFDAFTSCNYPPLAKAGVHITYFQKNIHYPASWSAPLELRTRTDRNVVILKLFPGISENTVHTLLHIDELKAVVLETFGSGNASRQQWLKEALIDAVGRGILIVNKTQCSTGTVEMDRYATGLNLLEAGIISGHDITTEALVSKLMYLLGEYETSAHPLQTVRALLGKSLCGEMTVE